MPAGSETWLQHGVQQTVALKAKYTVKPPTNKITHNTDVPSETSPELVTFRPAERKKRTRSSSRHRMRQRSVSRSPSVSPRRAKILESFVPPRRPKRERKRRGASPSVEVRRAKKSESLYEPTEPESPNLQDPRLYVADTSEEEEVLQELYKEKKKLRDVQIAHDVMQRRHDVEKPKAERTREEKQASRVRGGRKKTIAILRATLKKSGILQRGTRPASCKSSKPTEPSS